MGCKINLHGWCSRPWNCAGNFPSFSGPTLVGPTVINRTWIEFYCEANTTDTDTAGRFEVSFLFNGVVPNNVPVFTVSGPNPRAILHERYLAGRLDQLVRTVESHKHVHFFRGKLSSTHCVPLLKHRGVFRGEQGAMALPQSSIEWIFYGKIGFVKTVFTRRVLWTSNMPKLCWRPGLRPGRRWRSSRRSPNSLVDWGGGTRISRLRRSASVAPSVKSWLRPCSNMYQVNPKSIPSLWSNVVVKCITGHDILFVLINVYRAAFCVYPV